MIMCIDIWPRPAHHRPHLGAPPQQPGGVHVTYRVLYIPSANTHWGPTKLAFCDFVLKSRLVPPMGALRQPNKKGRLAGRSNCLRDLRDLKPFCISGNASRRKETPSGIASIQVTLRVTVGLSGRGHPPYGYIGMSAYEGPCIPGRGTTRRHV